MENKICIYAICRNESQFVEQWLESMKEADEIVVLDTMSEDDTYSKFIKYQETYPNLRVFQKEIKPWRFDVARNECLKLANNDCNIMMSTDLDEILEPGWADILKANWIDGVHERAVYKYTWSHTADGNEGRTFYYDKIHSRNWKWNYPVHELLHNTLTDSDEYYDENTLVLFDEIHLHHYPDDTKSRRSYLPLLELRVKENKPGDHIGLLYLAHEYYYNKMYNNAIETFNEILNNHSDYFNNLEKANCYLFLGDCYRQLNNLEEAKKNYDKSIEMDETYREPYLEKAELFIKEESFRTAEKILQEGLIKSQRHYSWLERDDSWTSKPFDLLCLIHFYQGRKKESLAAAIKAYTYDMGNERLKNNIYEVLNSMTDLDFM